MGFAEDLADVLRPCTDDNAPLALDLFAGCGGLALGFEAAGFRTVGYEKNPDAAMSYSANLHGECHVAELTTGSRYPEAAVIIGGPPCQPFSVSGKQHGLADARDGFPAFIHAVEQVRPAMWMFENVRGIAYRSKGYFDEILGTLRHLGYSVTWKVLNASDYGVPQNRQRVIVVGHNSEFEFPECQSRKITAGEALGPLAFLAPADGRYLTESMDAYVARYEKASQCRVPRDLHLDRPARTLTTRNLAGATSDMHRIRLEDGRRRMLTVREAARLQSFPDWYQWSGSSSSVFSQIGNAVPPLLSFAVAQAMRESLDGARRSLCRLETAAA